MNEGLVFGVEVASDAEPWRKRAGAGSTREMIRKMRDWQKRRLRKMKMTDEQIAAQQRTAWFRGGCGV